MSMKDCVSLEIAKKRVRGGYAWIWVPGYPKGSYYICKTGEVLSFTRGKSRRLKPRLVHGYPTVQLWMDGKGHSERIHRLLAKVFIHNPHRYPHVNHKDSNRANNALSNLEWCTSSMNAKHGFRQGNRVTPFKGRAPWNKGKKLTKHQRLLISRGMRKNKV